MSVIFTPQVQDWLDSLVPLLYEKEYFSYEESAVRYVEKLIDDIVDDLPVRQHRPAPPHYDRYGERMYYAAFRKNRATTWYAFFTLYDDGGEAVYLVRYIGNNHTDAQYIP